ncbi:MAG: hypothetical protein IKE89_00535 [Bacilli bacterium]|nr:hypothetical protein [Bacilli bacterium]
MPKELLKEFIDKNCTITLMGDEHIQLIGVVIAIEGYWIKIKEDECIRLINGAMIQDIKANK